MSVPSKLVGYSSWHELRGAERLKGQSHNESQTMVAQQRCTGLGAGMIRWQCMILSDFALQSTGTRRSPKQAARKKAPNKSTLTWIYIVSLVYFTFPLCLTLPLRACNDVWPSMQEDSVKIRAPVSCIHTMRITLNLAIVEQTLSTSFIGVKIPVM
jgi:hypothetical protein